MHTNRAMTLCSSSLLSISIGASMLVLTSSTARAELFSKVDCNGNCGAISLRMVCELQGTNLPIAVTCNDTAGSPSTSCGNGAGCSNNGSIQPNATIADFCIDGPGFDAIVYCKAPRQ